MLGLIGSAKKSVEKIILVKIEKRNKNWRINRENQNEMVLTSIKTRIYFDSTQYLQAKIGHADVPVELPHIRMPRPKSLTESYFEPSLDHTCATCDLGTPWRSWRTLCKAVLYSFPSIIPTTPCLTFRAVNAFPKLRTVSEVEHSSGHQRTHSRQLTWGPHPT